jgi:hypothetical protein
MDRVRPDDSHINTIPVALDHPHKGVTMLTVRTLLTRRFTSSPVRRRPPTALSFRPTLEGLESRLVLSVPTPDHVVVVIEENHAYSQIIGSSTAPYINSLAQQGASFTQSFALSHPSQPNYLQLFSGSNQGVTTDNCISSLFSAANLGSELLAAHDTFASYSEGLPSVGSTICTSGNYARKHNPSSDFSNVPTADNLPYAGHFPTDYSTLPTLSIVVPNLQDDMHDGTIQQGDTWLRTNLGNYVTWAQQHNSLLVVTWDEDDSSHNNQIPTLFVGPMVQPGQYSEHITHYNLLRTLEDMYNLPHAGGSSTANPITDVWRAQVDHFAVTTSATNPDVAGRAFNVTVTAQDANNNTVPGYTGTVTFSSQDPYSATLPGSYTFQASDNGHHTFPAGAALYTAGTWDVTATAAANGITGSANVNVVAAAADHFAVTTDAANPDVAGTPFDVTVTVQDAYNNTVTNYTGTVTFSSQDPYSATLPGSYTFQASDAGQVTFYGGTVLYTAGTWDVTVTDAVNPNLTGTTNVNVVAGSAVAFQVVTSGSALSGTPFDVTILAVDAYGNIDTNYAGTITFTSSDTNPNVVLPPDYTFQPGDAGQVTFSAGATLITPGPQTLTVTDVNSGITGSTTVTVM